MAETESRVQEAPKMTVDHSIVFLIDVDNTLLDNDRVQNDLRNHIEREFGPAERDRYWHLFETLFAEQGYADYLGAVQRFRLSALADARMHRLAAFLLDYPFADRLYPHALDVLNQLCRQGLTVILSDGDAVLQPRKIQRSGLWHAVEERVLIYIHKEEMLDDVERRFPAKHYVLVDDKMRILTAAKKVLGNRLTTVFPRQGHFALDPEIVAAHPPPDLSISCIGDLANHTFNPLAALAVTANGDQEAT